MDDPMVCVGEISYFIFLEGVRVVTTMEEEEKKKKKIRVYGRCLHMCSSRRRRTRKRKRRRRRRNRRNRRVSGSRVV